MTSDKELWQSYAATVKKTKKKSPSQTAKAKPVSKTAPTQLSRDLPRAVPETAIPDLTLDRRAEKNLRSGDLQIEARLDLHGMTQAEAFNALARFMARHTKMGHRNLLIITGKGRLNQGALRTNLRGWLESLPEAGQILAIRSAALRHGGDGAFYVILKRKKE